MTNGNKALARLTEQLVSGVENPGKEARLLLHKLCKQDPRLPSFNGLTNIQQIELTNMVKRRLNGEPLQYILEEWEFMGLPLKVGKGVLCPRPDSECIAEKAISLLKKQPSPSVLDLCAGSGALALAIKKFISDAQILAVEKYPEAFKYLEVNLSGSGIKPVLDDVLFFHRNIMDESISLIVSNPPYIPASDKPLLDKELSYEPESALFEPSFLYFYREIILLYEKKLKRGGAIVFEIPTFREDDITALLNKNFFLTDMVYDYNNTIRGVVGIKQ